MSQPQYPDHPAFDAFRANNEAAKDFMHNPIYKWIKDFSKPEAKNAEYSKNTARSIVSLWYEQIGMPVPDFNKETGIKKEALKTNFLFKQDVADEVIALALYYLEHGEITDEQRKYLHKILAKSSPSDAWKKLWWFEISVMSTAMCLVVLLLTYNKLGITPEQVKDIVMFWCVLFFGIDVGLLGSITIPRIYYTQKFNRSLKQR